MALKIKLTGVGLTVRHALEIGGTVANSLTATGTNQGTALLLSYDDCQVFTTVAAGTGCIFGDATVYCAGDQVLIANYGANNLSVYPATGGKIANGSTNAAVTIAVDDAALFVCIDGLNWFFVPGILLSAPSMNATISFVIDGSGTVISAGIKPYLQVMFACTIQEVSLLGDQTGSITVDIWKCTYAQFDAGSTHPVVGDSITASAVPAIASAKKYDDTTLTGWTKTINAGDILGYNISGVTALTKCTITFKVLKS